MNDIAAPPVPATAQRVAWGHIVVLVLSAIGLALNIVGGLGFPSAAPIEDAMNVGISIDLGALVVICGTGLIFSLQEPQGRPARVLPWLGLGFSLVAFVAWAVNAGGLFETVFANGRGRYMLDTVGPFYFGIPWVLGATFSAYGLRRGAPRARTAASIAGLVLWAVVLIGALASALLYAAHQTD